MTNKEIEKERIVFADVKIGDKVVNRTGMVGIILEVMDFGCFVDYGEYSEYEFNCDLKKSKTKKLPSLAKAFRDAEREKKAEIKAQELVKEFCERLSGI